MNRQFGRRPHSDNPDQIFGPGPLVVFLHPAVQERPEAGGLLNVKTAYPGRAVKLVGRKTEQIHPQFLDIHGNHPHRSDRIGVEGDFFLPGDPGDFLDGLDGPDLVIAVHDGHQDGLGGDGLGHLGRIHPSQRIHGNGTDLEIQHPQPAEGAQNGVVLDIGGDDMIAFFLVGQGHALDGLIDGFRAPGSENDFLGIGAVEQAGHLTPGLFQGLGGLVP